METYDVVVLGGGSAGETVATTVVRGGKSVAVVEERLVGGECPYFACMPSKAMLYSAEVRHRIGSAQAAGAVSRPWGLDDGRVAYRAAAARRHEISDRLDDSDRVRELQGLGVAVHRGRGRIVRPGALEIDGRVIGWTDLVIAVGSVVNIPEIEGMDRAAIWTSEDVYTTSDLPGSALVLGGGAVGCEIAQVLARFGAHVTIVQRAPRLIPAEEPAVAGALADVFRQEGIDVRLSSRAVRTELRPDRACLVLSDGTRLTAERLVVAAGRSPRLEGLGLETLSIRPGRGGFVEVDDQRASPAIPTRPAITDASSRRTCWDVRPARIIGPSLAACTRSRRSRAWVSHPTRPENRGLTPCAHPWKCVTLPAPPRRAGSRDSWCSSRIDGAGRYSAPRRSALTRRSGSARRSSRSGRKSRSTC